MEREYKAFISYRHLPLDMRIAKKVHKAIERYVIPRKLRNGGQKNLGIVFRDQDELPLSGSLSDQITTALDHSEFLIVICTPETAKSAWVLREITYFLETHDRDHVLAVLADGTADESFPEPIVSVRSADGDLLSREEPLAANIVAATDRERDKLFKTERLRLIAALLGCSYDELYKREARYKRRRSMAAVSVVGIVAAAFIGMLLDRNAEINRQLQTALRNESEALAAQSEKALREGDYNGAVRYALQALPGEGNQRPYVASAERQLNKVLDPYYAGNLSYSQSFQQDTDVYDLALSRDGRLAVTIDAYGTVRLFDTYSGKLKWETQIIYDPEYDDTARHAAFVEDGGGVLVSGFDSFGLYSITDGTELWRTDGLRFCALSSDQKVLLAYESYAEWYDEIDWDADRDWEAFDLEDYHHVRPASVRLIDPGTGKVLQNCLLPEELDVDLSLVHGSAFSPDSRYAALLIDAWPAYEAEDEEADALEGSRGKSVSLLLYDIEGNTLKVLDTGIFYSLGSGYRVCFSPEGDLAVAYEAAAYGAGIRHYKKDSQWEKNVDMTLNVYTGEYVDGNFQISGRVDCLACLSGRVLFGSRRSLLSLDAETGEILWEKTLPSSLAGAHVYPDGQTGLVLNDGTVTRCSWSGALSHEMNLACFFMDTNVTGAVMCGEDYTSGTFLTVPSKYPNRITVIRQKENELVEPVSRRAGEKTLGEELNASVYFYASPSGKWVMGMATHYSAGPDDPTQVNGILCNTETGECEDLVLGGRELALVDSAKVFLTDDRKLIADYMVYDIDQKQLTAMTESGQMPDRYAAPDYVFAEDETGQILSAGTSGEYDVEETKLLLWKNGELYAAVELPFTETDGSGMVSCIAIGGNGFVVAGHYADYGRLSGEYAVYSMRSGTWTSPKELLPARERLDEDERAVCLGEVQPYLADHREDGIIYLTDLETGMVSKQIPCSLPVTAVSKMVFSCGDRFLTVFSKMGAIQIYDVQSGQLLHESNYSMYGVNFTAYGSYKIYDIPDMDRLLIIYRGNYTETVCICLEKGSWECVGTFDATIGFKGDTNEMIVKPYWGELYIGRLLPTEELVKHAAAFLARE